MAISSVNTIIPNRSPQISNRKLKAILNHACGGERNFSYGSKKVLYDRLKGQDLDAHALAEEIIAISDGLESDFVSNLIFEHFKGCPECHRGIMKKIDLRDVHSYDYDKYGILPPYCSFCGCGYPEHIIVTR